MRQDTSAFQAKNLATAKEPYFVIEVAFSFDNSIVRYFTSHIEAALPEGVSGVKGVVEAMAGTSQRIEPDQAVATIGSWSFQIVDRASAVTTLLGDQLDLGRSTRGQRVRFYMGFAGLAWADYSLLQTQLVEEITFDEGTYRVRCADIQRALRKDIFDPAATTLATSLTVAATTVEVYDTSAFELVAHGVSYSDAPNVTVGYITIEDEIIRYTGKTTTTFTGCTRGALNTLAAIHNVDTSATADRRTKVEEYIYLEMPAVKLVYALATGVLYDQGGLSLPSGWNLGISTDFIRLTDFTSTDKLDLWNPTNDEQGFIVRFEGITKIDGKQFIERELLLLLGCFMPVYTDGALGLKRMANVLAGAAYSELLDQKRLASVGELTHDFKALHNRIDIRWNYEPAQGDTTRQTVLIDADSIVIHGQAETFKWKFRGLHGSRHSAAILRQRFDAIRDRYTGPPVRLSVEVLPSHNAIEVGDVVRVRYSNIRDFIENGTLDRSFEVQNVQIDWFSGSVRLDLFASSRAPGEIPPTPDAQVLPDSWYTSEGTNLASVLTITGSNPAHITANGNLTGNADLTNPAAIYYFDGDLVLDTGVTVTWTQNVQLRIRGFFTRNGTLSGVGGGHAGAAAVITPTSNTHYNAGTPGIIGVTEAGGGAAQVIRIGFTSGENNSTSTRGGQSVGQLAMVPSYNVAWDGTTLSGIPRDLRGSSGASGMPASWSLTTLSQNIFERGAGGAGGAGMVLVCRGTGSGVAGVINTSGAAGMPAPSGVPALTGTLRPGSGAGGAPGGMLLLLDGALQSATGLTTGGFVANYGDTRISHPPLPAPVFNHVGDDTVYRYSYYVGTGDGSTFPLPSLSGGRGGVRVQYVPGSEDTEPDPAATVLSPPTSLTLVSSGESLLNTDGTVTPRIKATWTPSTDTRTLGYELQLKRSTDSVWTDAPFVRGQSSGTVWLAPVRSGIQYDVRIRAAGDVRRISIWITGNDHLVAGTNSPPGPVIGLAYTRPTLRWSANAETDLAGYIVRTNNGNNADWLSGSVVHAAGYITPASLDLTEAGAGVKTVMVRAINASGLLGDVATLSVTLFPRNLELHEFAASNWTLRTNPLEWSLLAVVHNGSLWCATGLATGTQAYILTSTNGVDWIEQSNPRNANLTSIAWNGSVFCAVGGGFLDSYIVTSTGGVVWTERTDPKNIYLRGIAWNGAQFCAVGLADGTDAYILTSPDGVTWTERVNPKNIDLYGIVWNGSQFCAVGGADGTDAYILTSPDGVTWTERVNPKNVALNAIAWNGVKFCAVGNSEGFAAGNDAYILTSPDGVTWTEEISPKNVQLNAIAWNGVIFCAVGNAMPGSLLVAIMTSPDGITWTMRQGAAALTLNGIAWNGDYYCTVGNAAGGAARAHIATSLKIAQSAALIPPPTISWLDRLCGPPWQTSPAWQFNYYYPRRLVQ